MAGTKRKYASGLNSALFKALGHPIRYGILMIAGEREVTPTELAEMLDEDFQKVYKQVRALASGPEPLLELVGTDTRRGGEMHYFRAVVRPVIDTAAWDDLPVLAKETASALIAGVAIGEMANSMETGNFDAHPNRVVLRRPLRVDGVGAAKVDAAAVAYDDACVEAERESAERMAETGERPTDTLSALFYFQRGNDQKR